MVKVLTSLTVVAILLQFNLINCAIAPSATENEDILSNEIIDYSSLLRLNITDYHLDPSVIIHSLLNGKKLENSDELEDDLKFHWYPWKRKLPKTKKLITFKHHNDYVVNDNNELILPLEDEEDDPCEETSSIDDFPDDLFTQEQRLQGAIVLHFLGAIYFFSFLGVVINNYFIPSVQCICDDLKIPPDVGAAVFMSTATAMPEFFTNVISTFLTDSDMGLGTVIGSLMFNILGVAALSSLATNRPVRMDWWPVTRDCSVFAINVVALIIFSWDGAIMWWEAMILIILIFVYYFVMFQNRRIGGFMKRKFEEEYRCCNRNNYDLDIPNEREVKETEIAANDKFKSTSEHRKSIVKIEKLEKILLEEEMKKQVDEAMTKTRNSLWSRPAGDAKVRMFWWFYSWPIRFILTFTTPNPKSWRKMYPLTFFFCIIWIAVIAYLIFWMLIVIGYTFGIPESVMGMTFLAIGGCTPEMITGVIMSRRGQAAVGVANSLGASSLAILISLGLPWFIAGLAFKTAGEPPYTLLHSKGIQYTVLSLLGVVGSLYLCIALSRFFLKRITGLFLILFYCIFITFAILIEIDVFFPSGQGGTSLANSLGASSLTILISLGVPWLILAVVNNGLRNKPFVHFYEYGIEFVIMHLMFITLLLYIILYLSNFTMTKITGLILIIVYIISVAFALSVEYEIIFPDHINCK